MDLSQENCQIVNEEEETVRVAQITMRIVLPMIIKTAIELDLFEIMTKTPSSLFSSSDLVLKLPTQNPESIVLIERILRFLASQSILTSTLIADEHGDSKMLYGMTSLSKHFVRSQDGASHASSFLFVYDKVLVDCWYHLKDTLLEGGIPFNKAHGVNAFEYQAKDARFNELFNKVMSDNTSIAMKMILEKYKGFQDVKNLVDVGGGLGATLGIIVSKYPSIKGINYDLPHVIKHAPLYPGVEHVGGDMFQSVPKGDVIFMKWILHDWDDDHCIKLLKNCWAALLECGKVVVMDAIIPDPKHQANDNDTGIISQFVACSDMIMLIANPGGKERTMNEFDALAKEAGFVSSKIVCRSCTFWIMEFYKKV